MKAATIYERKDKLYFHSSSKTTAGVWVITAPVLAVDKENTGEVGRALRECLAASREGVSHPKSFTDLFHPVLELAGVKSFSTFVKSAKCIEVETSDDVTVTLIPTRNDGVDDGFAPLPYKTEATLSSDEALGSVVSAALAMAE
ncbi:hypothetical protein N5K27_28695 [Pigmentiphaga sp. GD03639]|uniref:hypothetical protein n=1 Tax=Pigmentiphaga sp. GD03639 TaxID=2975354 RepID=UPI00244A178B|nr:hypothetical protein [Pigmentiphaga sp. GD03639]MDH2240278.1 hypothetical protein [Pigmentiphaga sp. GD03639]